MKGIFSPSVSLMNSLTYPKKFILVIVISALTCFFLAYQLITASLATLEFSSKEILGVTYNNSLKTFIDKMQDYRMLQNQYTLGNQSTRDSLDATSNEIDLAARKMEQINTKLGFTLGTNKQWSEIANQWQSLKAVSNSAPTSSHFSQYTQIINNARALIANVCDNSNLTLDPDIDTYYLMAGYCNNIPEFMEHAAYLRDMGSKALITKSITPADIQTMNVLKTIMHDSNKPTIKTQLAKVVEADPYLEGKLNPLLQDLLAISTRATQLLNTSILVNNFTGDAKSYLEEYSNVVHAAQKLDSEVALHLQDLLQLRVNKMHDILYLNIAISVFGLCLLIYLFIGFYISVITNVGDLITGTQKFARGDLNTKVELKSKDELAEVARSFNDMCKTLGVIFSEITLILDKLSQGDLTYKNSKEYQGAFGILNNYINTTVDGLDKLIRNIKISTETINHAAGEISLGNDDLAKRTEQQAAFLEETAASIEELTATVKQNAENAKQADQLAQTASAVAVKGGEIVHEVVSTMTTINESSGRVADIIGVIDQIAFRTNILALNAAVEAARAGEQGRGFAVVASEVRDLAQRTSAAAQEIKILINKSVENVAAGEALVNQAGKTMEEIVNSVKHVTQIMSQIADASAEQSTGIEQVNKAATQMDQVTQQNTALVEEAANVAKSMQEQTANMESLVGVFKLKEDAILDAKLQATAQAKHETYPIPSKKIEKKKFKIDRDSIKNKKITWDEF